MKSSTGSLSHNSDKAGEQRKGMDERVSAIRHGIGRAGLSGQASPLSVRDLTKVYGAVTAVDRIRLFALTPRTTVALLGGNGAGKTTTIAMLLGLVDADLRRGAGCSAPT